MPSPPRPPPPPPPDAATREALRGFFLKHCSPPVCQTPILADQELVSKSGRIHYIQEIDCMKLLNAVPSVGAALFTATQTLFAQLQEVCVELCRETSAVELSPADVSVRLTHLPPAGVGLPSLPPCEGQLAQVCGSIVRMTTKRVVPFVTRLMCPRCHAVREVRPDPFDRAAAPKDTCEQAACKSEPLQEVSKVWMDYAECRLQQRSNQTGRLPKSVLVTLDDELASKCTVGQFVEVVGIIFPKWRHTFPLARPAIEPTIWAVNVTPMEAYRGAATATGAATAAPRRKAPKESAKFVPESFFLSHGGDRYGRNGALVQSVCPQLAGLFAPRMAVLLATLGGASTAGKTSMHVRSTIHCLFVGDPSTGKSQLLQFAALLAPRSTSTTGMGSTSAGLTVAASKENGEWVLEPGALVLSDGGACVIDELRTVSPADRASLHEAMEQQTISVAKGGMVTKLRTACSVLSACNPPFRQNGRTEIGVGGPLLSRFDFIFLLWDTPNPKTDEQIAEHVLSCNVASQRPDPPLQTEELARYLWWVQSQYVRVDGPLLSDRTAALLGRYYNIQRERGSSSLLEDAVPVTVRFLESLVRVTQAYGKLHLQTICSVEDAAMAIFLMERTAHSLRVPLYSLGPDIFSSSALLEDVFMDTTPAGVEAQRQVLAALVQVIENYGSGGVAPAAADIGSLERADGGDAEGQAPLSIADARRRTQAEDIAAGTIRVGGAVPAEVRESVTDLRRAVNLPSVTPQSVARYEPNSAVDPVSAEKLLASQLHSRRRSASGHSSGGASVPRTSTGGALATARAATAWCTPTAVVEEEEELLFPSSDSSDGDDDSQLLPLSQEAREQRPPPAQPRRRQREDEEDDPTLALTRPKRTAAEIMDSLRFSFN